MNVHFVKGAVSIPSKEVTRSVIIPPYRCPRRAFGERCEVRIDGFFLDCTVFLCRQTKTLRDPFATAFFVDWTDPNGLGWRYVVTARHCIEDVPAQEIFVRVNYGVGP